MKPFSLSKLCFLLILISFIFAACPSPYMNSYYIQQQNKNVQGGGSPEPDWGGGDTPPPEQPLEPGQISMFSVILRNGNIAEPKHDTTVSTQLSGKLSASDGFPFALYPTNKFNDWKFCSNFSAANVPEMRYSGTIEWEGSEEEQSYNGSNASAGSNPITSMKYFRYRGKNPFNLYANEKYDLYGEDGNPTGEKEALMKRFVFYRFTGMGGGLVALNNYLVAVDTYSKLVFSFAKPVEFKSVGGNNVPTKWVPVDVASTGPGGKKYRFYQYDPAGYVTEDGVFHMSDAYKNNLASDIYDPVYTGKSPYLGYVGNAAGNEELIPPLTGTLAVRVKYLKNISVSDAAGTDAEFTWDIRSRAYSGNAAPAWDSLERQLTDFSYRIPKDSKVDFTSTQKEYAFTGKNGPHILELDSEIIEIDDGNAVNPHDPITTKQKPVIFLNYDTEHSLWKTSGTNNTFINGEVTFDTNFTLADGEKKDFVITLPAPDNEKMELCYELYWEVEARPKLSISNPRLKNTSIWDLRGDGPKGGYKDAEFSYELKALYNSESASDGTVFSTNNGAKLSIAQNETGNLGGDYTQAVENPHKGTHTVRLSAAISEKDSTGSNDVIMQHENKNHEKPVIELRYDSLTDSWSPFLKLPADFEDSDGKWEVKSVSMAKLKRGKKASLTIAVSAYISELVYKDGEWFPSEAGLGDMELSFDVEWK